MKDQINFQDVARILNVREWGFRGPQSDKAKSFVNYLNEYYFTETDVFHLYEESFERFFKEQNDFEHSSAYWFAVFVADKLAKNKTGISFEEVIFFIQDAPSVRNKRRYTFSLYQSLQFEQRAFLLRILFLNDVINDLERAKILKTIPIEVTEAVIEKELSNEFAGDLTKKILSEIKLLINSIK